MKEKSRNDRFWRAKEYNKSKSDSWLSQLIEYHRPPSRTIPLPQTEFFAFWKHKINTLTRKKLLDSTEFHKLELILTFELLCAHDVDVRSWMWMCIRRSMLCDSNRIFKTTKQKNRLQTNNQRPWVETEKSPHSHVPFGELLIDSREAEGGEGDWNRENVNFNVWTASCKLFMFHPDRISDDFVIIFFRSEGKIFWNDLNLKFAKSSENFSYEM